ncbi:MAG TPA: hypothetical protein PKC39_10630 [Ferruginibacter sp.]|nr:hypothetical protein [Ferruginibacter sp.]HMP21403.1 hypothetical protein [Ferruginibacter sp.]
MKKILIAALLGCISFKTPALTVFTPATTTLAQQQPKLKKDGTPDKRFKTNKKLKKDGTPDKRFKQNKKKAG